MKMLKDTMDQQVRYKEIIVEVFRAFVTICETHQLRYYCAGGTAIGVVRHQGMIPWDDDIDILMPRPDYDKFLKVFPCLDLKNYELITMDTCNTYYLPFAKMCDKRTTLLEHANIPCLLGVFIDIFPLDGASDAERTRAERLLRFKRQANKLLAVSKPFRNNIKAGLKHLLRFELRTSCNEFFYAVGKEKKRKRVILHIKGIMLEFQYEDSLYVGNYGGMWGSKEFYPKEWFATAIFMVFEEMLVLMPEKYDAYLTQMYGDYMQLPSEDKRKSHHHVAYLSIDSRKRIQDVLWSVNKDCKSICYQMYR